MNRLPKINPLVLKIEKDTNLKYGNDMTKLDNKMVIINNVLIVTDILHTHYI